MGDFEFLIAVLIAAAVLVRLAEAIAVPYPIVLVIGGLVIGFLPSAPQLELEPAEVFLVFLPPLLHAAAWNASPQELRAATGQLVSLTVGLVLVTMTAVAVVAHGVIDGLSWEAAFVLGAILAPTDPVSASATFARLGAPERVALAVEGEAMLNDAVALVAYRLAVAALVSGTFTLADAAVDLATSAAVGIALGLAVGWLGSHVLRRLSDVPLSIFLTVLFAYAPYIAAEELGGSGVLATVTAGVWFGWHAPATFDADTRLSATAFWGVLVFGLNAILFILLGLQLPRVVAEVGAGLTAGHLVGYAAAVAGTVIVVRLAWQFLAPALARVHDMAGTVDTGGDWRERLVVGWSGMRGAISLAAVLAVPTQLPGGAPLPGRDLLIFLTAATIVATLVGQGLTLPVLMRALGIRGRRAWSNDEAIARLEAAQSALDRIDELDEEGRVEEEKLRRMRELYRARFRQCMNVLGGAPDGDGDGPPRLGYHELRRELIHVERAALLGLRRDGQLKDDVRRLIERDLDLEEARLRS